MKLKWEDDGSLKSGLTRARGLGSAKEGATTWLNERISAVASLPLTFWLIWSAVRMPGWSHVEFTAWLAMPVNAVLMILALVVIFYHAALGSRVIAEDYIHHEGFKIIKLMGINLFFFAAAVACIFAVLKIAFTAGI